MKAFRMRARVLGCGEGVTFVIGYFEFNVLEFIWREELVCAKWFSFGEKCRYNRCSLLLGIYWIEACE